MVFFYKMNRKQNLHATIVLIIEYTFIILVLLNEGKMPTISTILLYLIGVLLLIINYYFFDGKKDI